MDKKYTQAFISKIKTIKIPNDIDKIRLLGWNWLNYNLRYLLHSLNMKKLRHLVVGGSQEELLLDENIIRFYIPIIRLMINNIIIVFSNWSFSCSSFESIVKEWSKMDTLMFEWCNFNFQSSLNFKTSLSNLRVIGFANCYQSNVHSLKIDYLMNINKAIIGCSSLSKSVELLIIDYLVDNESQQKKHKKLTIENSSRVELNEFKLYKTEDSILLPTFNYSR